jgi:phosphoribosylformylglycinamidine synthase PurS subunit
MFNKTWSVDVVVMPKPGVNDPEGEAILGGLKSLGYSEVERVRSGKTLHLEIAAENETDALERASRMAERLLANPVIEVFEINVAGLVIEEAGR